MDLSRKKEPENLFFDAIRTSQSKFLQSRNNTMDRILSLFVFSDFSYSLLLQSHYDRTVIIWVVSKPKVLTFFVQNCFFGVLNRGSYEKKWDFSYKQDYLGGKKCTHWGNDLQKCQQQKLNGLVNQQRTVFFRQDLSSKNDSVHELNK